MLLKIEELGEHCLVIFTYYLFIIYSYTLYLTTKINHLDINVLDATSSAQFVSLSTVCLSKNSLSLKEKKNKKTQEFLSWRSG